MQRNSLEQQLKPYPGAFCFIEDEKYIIWEAQISRELPSKDQKYLKFNEVFLIFTKFEKENLDIF